MAGAEEAASFNTCASSHSRKTTNALGTSEMETLQNQVRIGERNWTKSAFVIRNVSLLKHIHIFLCAFARSGMATKFVCAGSADRASTKETGAESTHLRSTQDAKKEAL